VNTVSAQRTLAQPWLRPSVSTLVALTDDTVQASVIRRDPGLVLHILRFARPTATPDCTVFDAQTLLQPGLCETAATLLERDTDPIEVANDDHYRGLVCATIAEVLARKFKLCHPDIAWACGLLAGTFATAAVPPRQLYTRWRIPADVIYAIGFLDLKLTDAVAIGGHSGLLRVVRAAARVTGGINLFPETDHELDSFAPFLLEDARQQASEPQASAEQSELLPRLLRMCAKLRQRNGSTLVPDLERRVEQLVTALADSRQGFDSAVRDAKLNALAEFAAGASHEINNPLAVISTNVQLLKSEEEELERLDRFDAILRQTKRIHEILHGARQFARPPQPLPTLLATTAWVGAISSEYGPEAVDLGIRLELPATGTTVGRMWADPGHVRTILGHLVKNGIEAAGRGGQVTVKIDGTGPCTRIAVEDSGPGPSRSALPHLFDPFYSGRSAGRGRGLGLTIAWRLARQNGGDVVFDPQPGHPTRFVVSLPAMPDENVHSRNERRSA
jgi:two-component system, NtrC family, sensor kinase